MLLIVALLATSVGVLCQTHVDTIVIGAGWSGMGAAHKLHTSKHTNILVLEATNRTGGRTEARSFGSDSVGHFMFEMGSNWIDGAPLKGGPDHDLNPVYKEALEMRRTGKFDLTLIPGGTQNMSNYWRVYKEDGSRGDADGSIRKAAEKALDCLNRTASHGGHSVTIRDALKKCGWNPQSDVEWAVDWGFVVDDPGVAGDVQDLLLTYPDETFMWWGADDWFVVDQNPRGYSHVLDTMTRESIPRTDPRIIYNAEVVHIDYSSDPVKVTTKDGRTFTSKNVISTLPLGVMQHNYKSLFTPAMPDKQVAALTHKDAIMSDLTKVFLQFEEVFWDNDVARWLMADSEYGHFTEWHNMNHAKHVPGSKTLFLWLGQPQSQIWEKKTDEEAISDIMAYLVKRFPKATAKPSAFHMTRHSLNPYRYGSYSGYLMGWTDSDFDRLIKPLKNGGEKKVFFGGEHTCDDLNGFTHGAWIRGREVAMDLLGVRYETLCDD